MKLKFLNLILCLLACKYMNSEALHKENIKVAIIGGGIGGSSAAYYLLKNENINVDIYERRDRVGGRVYSQKVLNETQNFGASFLLKENQVIYKMITDLNVTVKPAEDEDGTNLGIFNDKSILLTLGTYDMINMFKVIWRYGLFSPLKGKKIIQQHLEKFNKIYDLLNNKNTSNTLHELLQKTENEYLMTSTIGDYLKQNGVGAKFVDELYNAVIAGIYNQHQEVNAYAGIVALIGSNNSPLSIVGGNDLLVKRIIEDNQANTNFKLFLNTTIIEISRNSSIFILKDSLGNENEYDIVIIACPIVQTNITFTNIIIKKNNNSPDKFIAPHLTYVKGSQNPKYFGLKSDESLPKTLISTDKNKGTLIQIAYFKDDIYKLVSEIELSEEQLESEGYFNKGVEIILKHSWNFAYPQFTHYSQNDLENLPEFVLEKNIYYINAIEVAASCMELSMISARNIVNIIENQIQRITNK